MEKFRMFFSLIVFVFLITLSFSPVYGLVKLRNDINLVFDFSFETPVVEKIEKNGEIFDRIVIDDLPVSRDYNKPCLPVKPLKILLPFGRDLKDVHVFAYDKTSLGVGFNIEVGGRLIPLVNTIQDKVSKDVVSSVDLSSYSSSLYRNLGVYFSHGFPILHINLFPVQYVGRAGELVFYRNIRVVVETVESQDHTAFRGLKKDFDVVEHIVDNPSYLGTYQSMLRSVNENYDYVIITNLEFKNCNRGYTFQDLMDYKISEGLNCKIVTVGEILLNQDYSVNGKWGDNNPDNPFYQRDVSSNLDLFDDIPARIRNFIRYAYMEWGTDYVLLGGDADVIVNSDNIIPLRGLFANESGLPLNGLLSEEEDDIPSDVYYACLDGCFNYDMDEHFGECADRNDVDDTIDEADLYSEVWVGRACIDSKEELNNFVKKTLEYEQMGFDPYISEILFVGEDLGSSFYTRWGGDYKDQVEDYVLSQYNLNKFYDRDYEDNRWYTEELFEYIYQHPPQIINHDGHGNHRYILKTSGDNIATLTNEKPFFIYSHSCLTGAFDNYNCWSGYQEDDCIAEILTCEMPYGAFACILNARFGLGSEDSIESPSGSYDESFYKALFTEDIKEIGAASHYSKEDNVWRIDENGYRWCYYETNLFGDPSLAIKDPNDVYPGIPDRPSGETNGRKGEPYTYSTKSIDPSGSKLYYWFDWGDGTNSGWVGPFDSGATATATHVWHRKGTFLVKVKAKNMDDIQSEWSDPLSVSMPRTHGSKLSMLQRLFDFFRDYFVFRVFSL